MSVWVTGDIHGNPQRFSSDIFTEQKEMTKNDTVIILGDFGLVWDFTGENKTEKYWLDWLEKKPFTTVFIDGNHDNFDRLDKYPVEEWHGGKVNFIRPSVIHLMRGQIFNIEDKTFFAFGGASSHDISAGILEPDDPDFKEKKKRLDRNPFALYRINHMSWWERELPNEEELKIGLVNLEKHDNKVDYIITHSPYTSLLRQMDGGSGLYQSDRLTDYLQEIKKTVDYKHWLFGHMHVNHTFHWEKSSCLYEQIIRIL
ncbi:MAG: metallophosphoesterase [Lachnospiraceae bacterium]|nr:metallophosphoesterase [Lachnospiraceae bacterium]